MRIDCFRGGPSELTCENHSACDLVSFDLLSQEVRSFYWRNRCVDLFNQSFFQTVPNFDWILDRSKIE